MPFSPQASKNIANFYACWDLMEITTLANLMALASEVTALSFETDSVTITETTFKEIVSEIFSKIEMLHRWLPEESAVPETGHREHEGGRRSGLEDFQNFLQSLAGVGEQSQPSHGGPGQGGGVEEHYQSRHRGASQPRDGGSCFGDDAGEHRQPGQGGGYSQGRVGGHGGGTGEHYQSRHDGPGLEDSVGEHGQSSHGDHSHGGRAGEQSQLRHGGPSQGGSVGEHYQPRQGGASLRGSAGGHQQRHFDPNHGGSFGEHYQPRQEGPSCGDSAGDSELGHGVSAGESPPWSQGECSQQGGGSCQLEVESQQIEPEQDEMYEFYCDMLFSGVVQCAQKVATQHGACQALVAFWKNSMGLYHENGKVRTELKMLDFSYVTFLE